MFAKSLEEPKSLEFNVNPRSSDFVNPQEDRKKQPLAYRCCCSGDKEAHPLLLDEDVPSFWYEVLRKYQRDALFPSTAPAVRHALPCNPYSRVTPGPGSGCLSHTCSANLIGF